MADVFILAATLVAVIAVNIWHDAATQRRLANRRRR